MVPVAPISATVIQRDRGVEIDGGRIDLAATPSISLVQRTFSSHAMAAEIASEWKNGEL
jgi:hypothetical protein